MIMSVAVVSTARIRAISLLDMGVSGMDNQQFDRELKYQVSIGDFALMGEVPFFDFPLSTSGALLSLRE